MKKQEDPFMMVNGCSARRALRKCPDSASALVKENSASKSL